MTLKKWFEQDGRSQIEIAREMGTSQGWLSELIRGTKSCSPAFAARISAYTKGAVTVQEILYPAGLPDGAVLEARTEAAA